MPFLYKTTLFLMMDQPNYNKNQIIWIPYIILLIITSVATGESLARTLFGTGLLTRLSFYLGSFVVLAILYSFGLKRIKEVVKNGSNISILTHIVSFLLLWAIASLYTNTHSIFILLNKDEIRRNELSNIETRLEALRNNTTVQLVNVEQAFKNEVEGLIAAMASEIRDQSKPGIGPRAREIITKIEERIGVLSILGYKNNKTLAEKMAEQATSRLTQRLEAMAQPRLSIQKLFSEDTDYAPLVAQLEISIDFYEKQSEEDIRSVLRRSYNKYQEYSTQIQPIFDTPFLGTEGRNILEALQRDIGNVPEKVESIELERIPNLLWYVRTHDTKSTFLWALLLALIIDIISFWVYYAGVLKNDDSKQNLKF